MIKKPELSWWDIANHLARGARLGWGMAPGDGQLYEREEDAPEDEALEFGFSIHRLPDPESID